MNFIEYMIGLALFVIALIIADKKLSKIKEGEYKCWDLEKEIISMESYSKTLVPMIDKSKRSSNKLKKKSPRIKSKRMVK